MSLSDLRVVYNLIKGAFGKGGATHKDRLESFYSAQAGDYDEFRKRLLFGREEMLKDVAASHGSGGIWVDMGGGTGANLEMMGDEAIMSFAKVYVVDLCGPLLEVARKRCEERGWHNVVLVEDDATTWVPEEGFGQVDVLTFSYSLTMIPDWFAAVEHAAALLRPNGLLGVADFYVARKHPSAGMAKHSWLQRTFWPMWFAMDDVNPNPDHLPYIKRKFETVSVVETSASMPYIGWVAPNMPIYRFIGRLVVEGDAENDEPTLTLPKPKPTKAKAAKPSVTVPEFQPPRMERVASGKAWKKGE